MIKNKDEEESLLIEIIIFFKSMNKYVSEKTSERNGEMNIYELFFLTYIEKNSSVTYYEMAKVLPFDQSYINKIIRRLEDKGLVKRYRVGKKKCIELTEKSHKLIEERPRYKEEFMGALEAAGVSRGELTSLIGTLKKINKFICS